MSRSNCWPLYQETVSTLQIQRICLRAHPRRIRSLARPMRSFAFRLYSESVIWLSSRFAGALWSSSPPTPSRSEKERTDDGGDGRGDGGAGTSACIMALARSSDCDNEMMGYVHRQVWNKGRRERCLRSSPLGRRRTQTTTSLPESRKHPGSLIRPLIAIGAQS